MEMEGCCFECESCSYLVLIPAEEKRPGGCPLCLGKCLPLAEPPSGVEWVSHRCPRCGAEFSTVQGALSPYKCPSCQFTFTPTPGKRGVERL